MSQYPMRIVIFSTLGEFADRFEAVFGAFGHRTVGILTTPGPPKNRNTSYLDVVRKTRPGIDVIVSTRPNTWADMLAPLRPDLIFSMGFPWLIPDDVINLPSRGAINVHSARLPQYRGPNPIGWAFRNGDAELGMTVHRLDNQFDTGNILATGSVPIDDDSDMDAIVEPYSHLLFQLLGQAFERVAHDDPGDPQPVEGASEAPFFEPEWQHIDWTNPRRTIHNQVRSWTGDRNIPKGALGQIDGAPHRVLKTRLVDVSDSDQHTPGSVLQRNDGILLIQCGDGPLEIVRHQPEL